MTLITNFAILVNTFLLCFANDYQINGFCGRPEKPFQSRLIPDKDLYREGEEVSYQCNQYWNHLQKKRCVRGQWVGLQFRCGQTMRGNDMNYIRVEDVSSEAPTVLFDRNLTLNPYWKFPQSFASSRFPSTEFQVRSDHLIRWTLGFSKPFSLPFFKLSFHFRNITVEESLNIELSANATISPYRQCQQVFRSSKRLWRGGTKVELEFQCNATSAEAFQEDIKLVTQDITLYTKSSQEIEYKLIAVMLGEPYETSDQHICGEPQFKYGVSIKALLENQNYSVECLDSMNYVSPDNPDLPETSIHSQKCVYDMRWKGSYPECVPKTVCPLPDDGQNQVAQDYRIVSFDNVYYFNETKWYAIDGTQVKYQCSQPKTQILLGDAIHVCRDGQWVGDPPNCFDLSEFKSKKIKNRDSEDDDISGE